VATNAKDNNIPGDTEKTKRTAINDDTLDESLVNDQDEEVF